MIALIAVVAFPSSLQGQQAVMRSSVLIRSTIVTSSRIFNNPDSPILEDRDHFDFVDNLLGGGFEYRLAFPGQDFFLSLSIEYVSRILTQDLPIRVSTTELQVMPIEQGVRFIPIELGVNTTVPLIGEDFTLTMGGGAGAYYAERIFGIAGTRMKPKSLPLGYGIHIESGFDYRLFKNVGVSWEMRFRDPEVINNSQFDTDVINADNHKIAVGNIPPNSKVNVHGVSFSLGVIFGFD